MTILCIRLKDFARSSKDTVDGHAPLLLPAPLLSELPISAALYLFIFVMLLWILSVDVIILEVNLSCHETAIW